MPINLNEPYEFTPSRNVPKETYNQAKIVGFECIVEPAEDSSITMRVQYGDTVDGKWVGGMAPVEFVVIRDIPVKIGNVPVLDENNNPTGSYEVGEISPANPTYSNWISSTYPLSTNNLLYAELAIALYSWLITQEGFEGTIV